MFESQISVAWLTVPLVGPMSWYCPRPDGISRLGVGVAVRSDWKVYGLSQVSAGALSVQPVGMSS